MRPDDPLAAMRANIDQAISGFQETARLLYGHYTAHVAAGFTVDQAMEITLDLHGALLRGEVTDGDG